MWWDHRDVSHFQQLFLRKKYGKNWNYLVELKLYVGIRKDNKKEEAEEDHTLEDAVCDFQEDIRVVLHILCCTH